MIQAIVTDIEGTTSSLSFVKDELFPYARARIHDYLLQHADDPAVREIIRDVGRVVGRHLTDSEAGEQLIQWIDEDKKITPLKALQGFIWADGYRRGAFHGHIYEDAARKLREWHSRGIRLYVYSSGSVKAQQLLFAHTAFGDLTDLFSAYFDTQIGGKREPRSYEQIINEVGCPGHQILFLSDIREELDAAKAAGMTTAMLVRDGELSDDCPHPQAQSFDDLILP